MNRIVQKITDNLVGLLPENRQYYKPDELRSWGLPDFIVSRIQVELKRNLAESMRLPETDWANMQSSVVQNIWQQFIGAIRNEAWLPASYAKTVIETAVADVLEILVQPRKNIPDVIFGADEKLTKAQIIERINVVVVYSHFANLLPRYMKKKGVKELTKARCAQIIEKADMKIIDRYTPLNWAQMLEPLFTLSDGEIDSSLLRIFFEDKKMPKVAHTFDLLDQSVNRARLIETLSSPDSINLDGLEDEQPSLLEDEAPPMETEIPDIEVPSVDDRLSVEEKRKSIVDSWIKEQEGFERDEQEDDIEYQEEQETVPLSNKSRESQVEIRHDDSSLNTFFEDDSEELDVTLEEEKDNESLGKTNFSLNDNFEEEDSESYSNGKEAGTGEKKNEKETEEAEMEVEEWGLEDRDDSLDENVAIEEAGKEETPMWKRFMSMEELQDLNSREEDYEDEFIEEPIFDITADNEPDEHRISEIQETLKSGKDYFVEEIFKGSERAYDEALAKIASKRNWRNATRYIEKEVFQRNLIDLYSEEAVEFTDRLHNYFIENSEPE